MWIDSHCHLNHARFEGLEPSKIIEDARANDIQGMVTICCRMSEEYDQLKSIAETHDDVWFTVGTHPHDAGNENEKAISQEEIVKLAKSHPKIVGIGESGLDYYYDYAPREDQEMGFRKHIRACIETDMPLIVHARDADEDIANILKEESAGGKLRGVMHCFSSGRGLAEAALDLGFYISFSGIVTFGSAKELQSIAKDVPADKILVETDAPFLAPTPHRGKTNMPAYVRHTGEFVANLRGTDVQAFAKQTRDNFFTLFDRAAA